MLLRALEMVSSRRSTRKRVSPNRTPLDRPARPRSPDRWDETTADVAGSGSGPARPLRPPWMPRLIASQACYIYRDKGGSSVPRLTRRPLPRIGPGAVAPGVPRRVGIRARRSPSAQAPCTHRSHRVDRSPRRSVQQACGTAELPTSWSLQDQVGIRSGTCKGPMGMHRHWDRLLWPWRRRRAHLTSAVGLMRTRGSE
jgi:hypothetical protein